jgi:ubiquitin-conjugating enzyme E2 S
MSIQPAAMRRLMRELTELKNSPPEGIRVITSDDNMLDVSGIIEGPEGTPYAGGYFTVKFKFTEEFPAAPPKCWFATKIFHPNVSTAGEICVNTLKKDWKSTYGIGYILVTVKCLLIYPNPESALDEEAGKLLLENYDSYCERAKLITGVHATPRIRPVEFDAPASPSASTSKTTTSLPTHPPISTLPTPLFTIPVVMPILGRKSASPSPPSQPLQASPSNTRSPSSSIATTSLTVDKDSKERHTSPSPLGTADSNVEGKVGAGVMGAQMTQTPTKAVKRAAGAGVTGAEKRKKALKRL